MEHPHKSAIQDATINLEVGAVYVLIGLQIWSTKNPLPAILAVLIIALSWFLRKDSLRTVGLLPQNSKDVIPLSIFLGIVIVIIIFLGLIFNPQAFDSP